MSVKKAGMVLTTTIVLGMSGAFYASVSCEQCGNTFHCDTTTVADTYNWSASGPGYWSSPNSRAYRRWQCPWSSSGSVTGNLLMTVEGGSPPVQQEVFGFYCPVSA